MFPISDSNIDINPKEIKEEQIPEDNISDVSIIIIDDSSDTSNDTPNSEILKINETKKETPPPPSTSFKEEDEEDEILLSNSGINVQLPIY